MIKPSLFFVFFSFIFYILNAQPPILQEDFKNNTSNATNLSIKSLGSGDWSFYYADKNYNNIIECVVLKYSSANMGYVVTPKLKKPSLLRFSARTVGNVNNSLILQKSINGGAYITFDKITVGGLNFKQYLVSLNDSNEDVQIRFLRSHQDSESSNYNIILDNVQIWGTGPTLQVSNINTIISNGQTLTIPVSRSAQSVEFPLTLSNTGNEQLELSSIEALGASEIVGNKKTSLLPGQSLDITLRFSFPVQIPMSVLIKIESNSSGCSPYIFLLELQEPSLRK